MTVFHSSRSAQEGERRREFLAAGLLMLSKEPWRVITLLLNLALAIFLLREFPREHPPGFWGLLALVIIAITIGNAWLARFLRLRREQNGLKNPEEEKR